MNNLINPNPSNAKQGREIPGFLRCFFYLHAGVMNTRVPSDINARGRRGNRLVVAGRTRVYPATPAFTYKGCISVPVARTGPFDARAESPHGFRENTVSDRGVGKIPPDAANLWASVCRVNIRTGRGSSKSPAVLAPYQATGGGRSSSPPSGRWEMK